MRIDNFQLLRNVGQFDSVSAGGQLPLAKLTTVYAENGRGKTTLAAVLRAGASGDAIAVSERQRLGSAHPPHVVLGVDGQTVVFQRGVWSAPMPHVAVFDDAFVAANVCSGIEIGSEHRQNLHELILGAQGVSLNEALRAHVAQIEEHNRTIRTREQAIPAQARGALSVDAFCALPPDADVDNAIAAAERNLAAARSAEAIRQRATFIPLTLPDFDIAAINAVLSRTLPDLQGEAAARVRSHIRTLGRGGEAWVGEGFRRAADTGGACPFCAQDLRGSDLIAHYQAYFSDAYERLKAEITATGQGIVSAHGGEVPAAFERAVRVAVETREFWRAFIEVPDVAVETAAVARAWTAAREAVLTILRAKAAAPLEALSLSTETLALIDAYDTYRSEVEAVSAALQASNEAITLVKEQAASANVAALESDLSRLRAVKARYTEPVAIRCQEYIDAKAAKAAAEAARDQAREALNDYRQNVFPAYETAINTYLQRFNAGFRLAGVSSVNNRGGSSCTYTMVINSVPVALTAQTGPSFRNTLSAGDRNALALAFFFAALDQSPHLADKVVVIDDPMTSLDEHRSLTTVQEIRRLLGRVSQVIVLSHSKPFLCALWDGADTRERAAIRIVRDGSGSTLAAWDVRQDSITEHDRRHQRVANYLRSADPATERQIAASLRPILEAFMRVAYPADFPPGTLLGPFLGICEQRVGTSSEILSRNDITELRELLGYANRFHHDTNPAWEVEAINDQELAHFCSRTLAFARRP